MRDGYDQIGTLASERFNLLRCNRLAVGINKNSLSWFGDQGEIRSHKPEEANFCA